jgi:hypothetical protein
MFDNHSSDCFRGWVVAIHLGNMKLNTIPSFRNRWDCDGCLPQKFGRYVEHLTGKESLCFSWDDDRRRTSERARASGKGYMRMSLDANDQYALVSDVGVVPGMQPMPAIEALRQALLMGFRDTITRLSFNEHWRPEPRDPAYHAFPTFKDEKEVVKQAIIDSGFASGKVIGCDVYTAENRIREHLETRSPMGFDEYEVQ